MGDHAGGSSMRLMYIVWFWLLAVTLIEVFLAYLQTPIFWMLLILLGLSLVKAALIMAYFMHLKFERLNLILTLIPALILCILLLNVIFPDAMRLTQIGVNRTVTFEEQAPADSPGPTSPSRATSSPASPARPRRTSRQPWKCIAVY